MTVRDTIAKMEGLANCEADPEAFFPVDPDDPTLPDWALSALATAETPAEMELYLDQDKALDLCRTCTVRLECLGVADQLDADSPQPVVGIWGGLTLSQRRTRRRQTNRATRAREIAQSLPKQMLHRTEEVT